MRSTSREFGRFLLAGCANTLVTYALYLAGLLVWPYVVAYTLAYAVGILLSYYLNARFVFRVQVRSDRALAFPLVYALQYLAGIGLIGLMVEVFGVDSRVAAPLAVVGTTPLVYGAARVAVGRNERSRSA